MDQLSRVTDWAVDTPTGTSREFIVLRPGDDAIAADTETQPPAAKDPARSGRLL